MSITTTALSITLATANPSPAVPTPNHVETLVEKDSITVLVYDANSEVVGSIALFVEPDGSILTVSDYSDGYAQATLMPDGAVVFDPDSTLPPYEVAQRAEAVKGLLPTWARCALGLTASVVGLASGNPLAMVPAYYTACYCVGKWENVEIPC